MDEKLQITIEMHNLKSAEMDDLCDANDYDGIIVLCRELESYTHPTALIRLHIYYNIGSGYTHVASRRDNNFASKISGLALLNFRKALAETRIFVRENFDKLYSDEVMETFKDLRNRLLTNLANELDYQGRRLEALTFYEEPINSGNVNAVMGKAGCLYRLAQSVYDDGHAYYLYKESARCYQEALERVNEFHPFQQEGIKSDTFYTSYLNWFHEREQANGSESSELDNLSGRSFDTKKEQDYFGWCADHRLFINELNAISVAEVVNHDILSLPSFGAQINPLLSASEQLSFHGHFDEMKTDYCYARYLAYMGNSIPLFDEHFFNSTFEQVNTLDYEINNLKTNHLKSCFRISYSLFDKISFFLHRFFKLDEVKNDHKVDFKKVWFKHKSQQLKDIFEKSDNEYFRALYFISHEIRQGNPKLPADEDLSYWFDPDTQRLFNIRNAMEHRSLKLVDGVCFRLSENDSVDSDRHINELLEKQKELESLLKAKTDNQDSDINHQQTIQKVQEHISRLKQNLDEKERMSTYSLVIGVEEFEALTMKLLTLAKDALIYLSLAIHHEEKRKPDRGLMVPRFIPKK